MNDRLYRHPTDRVIAGVAGGLATWLNIDPSLVRVAWVLLALFSGGLFVLVYIVMMVVVPLPPPGWIPGPRGSAGPSPGTALGWQPGTSWGSAPSAGWGAAAPGGATGAPGSTGPDGTAAGWSNPGDPPAAGNPAPAWGVPPPGGWPSQPAWTAPKPGNAGLIVGGVLVAVGVWFLIDQYVNINWELFWPVMIMIAGGALIAGALLRGRSA